MVQITFRSMTLIIIPVVILLGLIPAFSVATDSDKELDRSEEKIQPGSEINGLEVARLKLKRAIDNYKDGNLDAARHNLEVAIEWLNKASKNSKTKKSRQASRQLAVEIDAFKQRLDQLSEENENILVRFWHQTTAIIGREIDHLVHSYVELASSENTLRYLLDAKMHLYTAEHDLIVSHEFEDSVQELDSVLDYLDQAGEVAKTPLKEKIKDLRNRISLLEEQVKESPKAWQVNEEIALIDQAKENLTKVKDSASPQIILRIETIEADIHALRIDIERSNIKNSYESCMATLRGIIDEL